jgi:two-component system phosphate regulon sensor histidine kinase PhoR
MRRAVWPSARFPFGLGAAVAALVLGLCGGWAWWTERLLSDVRSQASRESAVAMGQMVAHLASARLGAGDSTALWLELRQIASEQGLSACRVLLPDGRVIADGLGPQGAETELPDHWEGVPAAPHAQQLGAGWEVQLGTEVARRGPVQVVLATPGIHEDAQGALTEVGGGLAVFAALGVIGAAATGRSVHARMWRLAVLRRAVASAARGGTAESLSLANSFGPDAAMWNQIVGRLDELRRQRGDALISERDTASAQSDRDGAIALDGLWLGVLLLDGSGRIEYCNGAAGLMLGGIRDAMVGTFAHDVLPQRAAELARGGAIAPGSVELEVERSRQDKALLRFTARSLGREGDACTMLVVEDITQQRIAEESRNAFVTQATHELRTPLTNMRLYLETLVEEGDADPAVKSRCLNVLSGAVRRLERVVSDMLSVSEIEAGSLKLRLDDVRPEELFEEIGADFKAVSEDKEIALVFELPPKFETLQADRDKLVLAIHNLVGNALKYTPAGGEVRVRVEQELGGLAVHVTDNGIGIRQEECELIFERFYRAKDRRVSGITGSGLGLALSRQIARLHGGDVTVQSVIDRGSTFTLRVPSGSSEVSKAA